MSVFLFWWGGWFCVFRSEWGWRRPFQSWKESEPGWHRRVNRIDVSLGFFIPIYRPADSCRCFATRGVGSSWARTYAGSRIDMHIGSAVLRVGGGERRIPRRGWVGRNACGSRAFFDYVSIRQLGIQSACDHLLESLSGLGMKAAWIDRAFAASRLVGASGPSPFRFGRDPRLADARLSISGLRDTTLIVFDEELLCHMIMG